jgi:hypothetical protein
MGKKQIQAFLNMVFDTYGQDVTVSIADAIKNL